MNGSDYLELEEQELSIEYEGPQIADYEDAVTYGKSPEWISGYWKGKEQAFREAKEIINRNLCT